MKKYFDIKTKTILPASVLILGSIWVGAQNRHLNTQEQMALRSLLTEEEKSKGPTEVDNRNTSQNHQSEKPRRTIDPASVGLSENFRRFQRFHHTALPGLEQKAEIETLLSDPLLIQEAKVLLSADDQYMDTEIGTQRRLLAVDYLGKALQWSSNPARKAVKQVSMELITRNLDELHRPRSLKRLLAGDQIELYQYLLRTDRAEALALFESESNSPQGALMAYVIQFESDLIAKRKSL